MTTLTLRRRARTVIRATVDGNKHLNPIKNEYDLRKLINNNYPFGARKYHPYKIWLDEVEYYFIEKKKIDEYNKGLN